MIHKKTIFILAVVLSSFLWGKTTQLSQHPYWLKLLHYENNSSIITNQNFFLSADGKTNPKNELLATINGFQSNPKLICKYPARFKWLSSKFELNLKKPKCEDLEKFMDKNFHDLSIVFTSERYNSPASVFGHTFIKVKTNSFDYAIDYSATTDSNDSMFSYVYKGLTGKYPSSYKLIPYSYKDYEYRAYEFRDLIEYKLDFSKDEIENIFLHLYEIENIEQQYYFISRNCSSELIKLFDLKDEKSNMSKDLKAITVPIEIVYILQKNNLVSSISQESSKLKIFFNYLEKLDKTSWEVFSKIIYHQIGVQDFALNSSIDFEQKKLIILSAIKYYEILSTSGNFNQKDIYPFTKLIGLKQTYQIEEKKYIIPLQENPISNKLHKLTFGHKRTLEKDFLTLGYRALYRHRYDMVDNIIKNGSVEFFDLELKIQEKNPKIEYFHLLNIESIPLYNKFFPETTNRITFGGKRIFYHDDFYGFFEYTKGYKLTLVDNLYYKIDFGSGIYSKNYLFVSGFVNNSIEFFSKNFITTCNFEYNAFDDGNFIKKLSFENHYKVDKTNGITFAIKNQQEKNYKNDIISLKFSINF